MLALQDGRDIDMAPGVNREDIEEMLRCSTTTTLSMTTTGNWLSVPRGDIASIIELQ